MQMISSNLPDRNYTFEQAITPPTSFNPHMIRSPNGTYLLYFRVNDLDNHTICTGDPVGGTRSHFSFQHPSIPFPIQHPSSFPSQGPALRFCGCNILRERTSKTGPQSPKIRNASRFARRTGCVGCRCWSESTRLLTNTRRAD
jgi:hypothetical protein